MLVLGSTVRADLPMALGSVSHRLLHHARRPVLIVPRNPNMPVAEAAASATATAD